MSSRSQLRHSRGGGSSIGGGPSSMGGSTGGSGPPVPPLSLAAGGGGGARGRVPEGAGGAPGGCLTAPEFTLGGGGGGGERLGGGGGERLGGGGEGEGERCGSRVGPVRVVHQRRPSQHFTSCTAAGSGGRGAFVERAPGAAVVGGNRHARLFPGATPAPAQACQHTCPCCERRGEAWECQRLPCHHQHCLARPCSLSRPRSLPPRLATCLPPPPVRWPLTAS